MQFHSATSCLFKKNLTFRSCEKRIIGTNLKILKKRYYSYSKIPLINFNVSITTYLRTMDFYLEMPKSNSFDLIVLFNWGWSRFMNKRSLIRSLNLFASEAKISKWSKSIEQLHSIKWADTADTICLIIHLKKDWIQIFSSLFTLHILVEKYYFKGSSVSPWIQYRSHHWCKFTHVWSSLSR